MDPIQLPEAVWHRVQAAEQTMNGALSTELVTCAAICLEVPIGYRYDHPTGAFVPLPKSDGLVDFREMMRQTMKQDGQTKGGSDEAPGQE